MPASVKRYATAYLMFLGFTLLTAAVVAPAARKFNVPLLKDI